MPQPAEVEALSANLRQVYADAQSFLDAEMATIADDPAQFRRRARLRELQGEVALRMADADEAARAWLADEFPIAYRIGAESAGGVLDEPFRWTVTDTSAVTTLAQDSFDELLAATKGVNASTKSLIRRLAKEQALLKEAAGRTATQASRDLRRLLEQHQIYAVRYRNGAKHSIGDYTEMLLRTVSAKAHNAGTINFARRSGVKFMECFDGFDCGLSSHQDSQKANGLIVPVEVAAQFSIAHPRCQRAWGARPDLTTLDGAKPTTTPEQRADQAASELARREAQRKAALRRRQQQRRTERLASRAPKVPTPPPDPAYPGNLSQKDAERWMQNRWGVDAGGQRVIMLDGLGDQAANAMARTMDALMRRFPNTGARVRIFGASSRVTSVANQIEGLHYPRINGRAYADAAPKSGMIRLNQTRAKKYAETIADLESDVATGFHPPGTASIESVVAHEFGHHLKWQAEDVVGKARVKAELDAVVRRHAGLPEVVPGAEVRGPRAAYEAKQRYETMRGMSRYAATDLDELAGEALSEVTMSPSPRPFAHDVVATLARLGETG